jgi:hypothetical protein
MFLFQISGLKYSMVQGYCNVHVITLDGEKCLNTYINIRARGTIPGRGKIFLLSRSSRPVLGLTQPIPGGKAAGA